MAEKKITYIPPKPQVREKRVGIYCRVRTNSTEQLNSLTAQISAMTRFISINPKWLLRDIYIDISSGKAGSQRKEFSRMLQDCNSKDLDIILTKKASADLDGILWKFIVPPIVKTRILISSEHLVQAA